MTRERCPKLRLISLRLLSQRDALHDVEGYQGIHF